MPEGGLRKPKAEGPGQPARGIHLPQDLGVGVRAHDHSHRFEILGGCTEQGRPAHIDLLDHLVERGARQHGLLKRVQVHDHEIERRDAVLSERSHVLRLPLVREDAGMDPGMQRLHSALEHLGKAGDLGDRCDGDPGFLERGGGGP